MIKNITYGRVIDNSVIVPVAPQVQIKKVVIRDDAVVVSRSGGADTERAKILYSRSSSLISVHNVNADAQILSYSEVLSLMRDSYNKLKNSERDECAILVCGGTGAGKSTLVNHLFGRDLIAVPIKNTSLFQIECSNPIAKIGGSYRSSTLIPDRFTCDSVVNQQSFVLWDCPGFKDNREGANIVNTFSINKIGKYCAEKVKVLIVVSESEIEGPARAGSFRDSIRAVREIFSDINLEGKSVFCFTKAMEITDYDLVLTQVAKDTALHDDRELILSIVRNNSYVVFDCPSDVGPVSSNVANVITQKLNNCSSVENQKLRPVLSHEDKLYLKGFAEYLGKKIAPIINFIISEITKSGLSGLEEFERLSTALNNHLPEIVANSRSNPWSQIKSAVDCLENLASTLHGKRPKVLDEKLEDMNFVFIEIFEDLYGAIGDDDYEEAKSTAAEQLQTVLFDRLSSLCDRIPLMKESIKEANDKWSNVSSFKKFFCCLKASDFVSENALSVYQDKVSQMNSQFV